MSSSADAAATRYDGFSAHELRERLGVPRIELFESVSSTLDVAHAIAESSPAGTLILANEQLAGRGRQGRRWSSMPGAGVWLTLVERATDGAALDVLALRCGIEAARALEPLSPEPIRLKWPNDLYAGSGKLAGILIETRWRGTTAEWVAIGFGVNVIAPPVEDARGLASGTSRIQVLERLVPALRRAALAEGPLSSEELSWWRGRDFAAGRRTETPAPGIAEGISPSGELLVRQADGVTRAYRSGSLTFA